MTSSSLCRRRQFSTAEAHPWPVSPKPWMKMTVAVWREAAGKTKGAMRADISIVDLGSREKKETDTTEMRRIRKRSCHGRRLKIHMGCVKVSRRIERKGGAVKRRGGEAPGITLELR